MAANPEYMDLQRIADDDELRRIEIIRDEVGDIGLTDDQMDLYEQYYGGGTDHPGAEQHDANLAEFLPDDVLSAIGQRVVEMFDWDHESRMPWYQMEVRGLRMLGVSPNTDGGAAFEGATRVVHPLLAEAAVQFQARTMPEVWPADGPVNTMVIGESNDEAEKQGQRVKDYMNYQLNLEMPGVYEGEDMAYLRLPLSGSVFKKIYHDPVFGHMDDYVAPEDFVVPYNASDLRTAPRFTHVEYIWPNDVKRYQLIGYYRDVELPEADENNLERPLYREIQDTEGDTIWEHTEDQRHTMLSQHVNLDIDGFEHKDEETGDVTGFELPYVVTVDYDSQVVVAIRRNWREGDAAYTRRQWFVHKKFIPGFGFYGYGLYHWIGSLTRAAIGALRALLDAAQFANLPGGYRSKVARGLSGEGPVAPGEFRETELNPEDLQNAFFPLPYKEPSVVLFNLLGHIEQIAQRFASTTDVLMGEGNKSVPVGTTLARIDQGLKVFGSIFKRIHRANSEEYQLLAEQFREYMPPEGYPFAYQGHSTQIAHEDFDGRVDIIPVSDPEVSSSTQRLITSQLVVELANSRPELYNMRNVHARALSAARVPNIEELLVPEDEEPVRMGPVEENMAMQMGEPVKTHADEDHEAHMVTHMGWFESRPKEDQEMLGGPYYAHMAEHKAWAYYAEMTQMMGGPLPTGVIDGEAQELDPEIERQLSLAAAQATQLMLEQQPPSEEEVAAMESQSEIGRKDAESQADIQRDDRESAASINRENLETEASIRRDAVGLAAKTNLGDREADLRELEALENARGSD